jgi:hypothetical protein
MEFIQAGMMIVILVLLAGSLITFWKDYDD